MVKRSRPGSDSSSGDDADYQPAVSRSVSVETTSTKYTQLDPSAASQTKPTMRCLLPPHEPLSFASIDEYEVHYQQAHTNRCSRCRKNFPTEHYLHLHISEHHDPLSDAKRARGDKTYACFLPECDRLCSTPFKRRLHCIDKHGFPQMYDFFIVNDGIDTRTSMLRTPRSRRRSSLTANGASLEQRQTQKPTSATGNIAEAATEDLEALPKASSKPPPKASSTAQSDPAPVPKATDPARPNRDVDMDAPTPSIPKMPKATSTTKQNADVDMDVLTSSMSTLRFVPNSIRFGRGKGKGGLARQ